MSDTEGLVHILKAPSKEFLQGVFNDAFKYRLRSAPPQSVLDDTAKQLQITGPETKQLYTAAKIIAQEALFESLEPARIVALFPVSMQKNSKLAVMIAELVPAWKQRALDSQVSLPKLVDFDWRVDIKTASESASKMGVPSVLVQMKVKNNPTTVGEEPATSTVTFELTKETLETMLDGLGKIRDQMASVASN